MNPMGFRDFCNYVIFDNPISKTTINATKSLLGGKNEATQLIQVIKQEAPPLWELASRAGPFVRIAGASGTAAVILGAYGAHKTYPKDRVDELKRIYETGNRFHFFHTLALFGVPFCKQPKITGSLLIFGTLLFSGPCYVHAFTGENKFGRLAPIGGSLLILAWISMVL